MFLHTDSDIHTSILDLLLHALEHTALILPFLFFSYLLIEYITHRHSKKINNLLIEKRKYNSFYASFLGVVPQCGFSSLITNLFSSRLISLGTLIAVLIATSDEALLLLFSHGNYLELVLVIVIKVILGFSVGLIIDRVVSFSPNEELINSHNECSCNNKSIIFSALKHTFIIFIFVFCFYFIFELIIELIGEDTINQFLLSGSIFQPVLAAFVGLIPNCASSILLTELYISNSLSFGSLICGLIINSGIAIIVLFKNNKNLKQNIKILILLFSISCFTGIFIQLIENFI